MGDLSSSDTHMSTSVGNTTQETVARPGDHDVLLGRGRGMNNHSGNIKFRELVNEYKMQYLSASQIDKPKIARKVVEIWRKLNPPGRFLTRLDKSSMRGPGSVKADGTVWYDVGDQKAREKTSQCLRERTTEYSPHFKYLNEHPYVTFNENPVSTVLESMQFQQKAGTDSPVSPQRVQDIVQHQHFFLANQSVCPPRNIVTSSPQSTAEYPSLAIGLSNNFTDHFNTCHDPSGLSEAPPRIFPRDESSVKNDIDANAQGKKPLHALQQQRGAAHQQQLSNGDYIDPILVEAASLITKQSSIGPRGLFQEDIADMHSISGKFTSNMLLDPEMRSILDHSISTAPMDYEDFTSSGQSDSILPLSPDQEVTIELYRKQLQESILPLSPDQEITIELYRKQLQEYLEKTEHITWTIGGQTFQFAEDGYESDLEDDWEQERDKNLQGAHENCSASGFSFMSFAKSRSVVSGIIENMLSSDIGYVADSQDVKMSASRSALSLMSELTFLAENLDIQD